MAAEYIQVTLDDFEEQFNVPHKKDPSKRAFDLFRPEGQEAYYLCKLSESKTGTLYLKVFTSIRSDRRKARAVGQDAIRIVLAWQDKDGWFKCLHKGKRVFRSGGKGATAHTVVKRTIDRAREVALGVFTSNELKECPKCSRPMVIRKGYNGEFYGCIGYAKDKTCTCTMEMS